MNTRVLPASDPAAIEEGAALLRGGALVAFPTETVYGLGANALDGDACRAIFAAKGRPADNPLIVHVTGFSDLAALCGPLPPGTEALCRAFWPGPLTLVLPKGDAVPSSVSASLPTLAVRCPDHKDALALLKAAGVPVAAPSANRSGRPSPTTAAHVKEDLDGVVPLILDGGPCPVGMESTILDLTVSPPALLRPGGLALEELVKIVGPIAHEGRLLQPEEAPKAPGMKYRHYAPRAPLTVCEGSPALTARAILDLAGPGDGVLAFDEYRSLYPEGVTVLSFGSRYAPKEHAARLFDGLRRFDAGDFPALYAPCPAGEKGLDRAVRNRLKKASGGRWLTYDKTVIVGLTGRSCSGKSTVGEFFRGQGAEVIDCDQLYHLLLREDEELQEALYDRFGPGVRGEDGFPSTRALGEIVFSDKKALDELNYIAHRAVDRTLRPLIEGMELCHRPMLVLDAPTLFEAGADRLCDQTVAILAPEEDCVARIVTRDGVTPDYARARIASQPDDAYLRARADHVIDNRGGPDELLTAAKRLYAALLPKEES